MNDDRIEPRYPVSVAVHGWNSNMDFFEGHTRDVSPAGVYIIAKTNIKSGERFTFLMNLPGLLADEKATAIWAFCRAVRVERLGTASGTVGIAAAVEEYVIPTRGLGAGLLPLQAAR